MHRGWTGSFRLVHASICVSVRYASGAGRRRRASVSGTARQSPVLRAVRDRLYILYLYCTVRFLYRLQYRTARWNELIGIPTLPYYMY